MSNNEMAQMPQYQCHKKVRALKIETLKHTGTQEHESDGSLLMIPENKLYEPFILDAKFVSKHNPKEGGYYIVYDDGYASFSPAQAFESGYTLLE